VTRLHEPDAPDAPDVHGPMVTAVCSLVGGTDTCSRLAWVTQATGLSYAEDSRSGSWRPSTHDCRRRSLSTSRCRYEMKLSRRPWSARFPRPRRRFVSEQLACTDDGSGLEGIEGSVSTLGQPGQLVACGCVCCARCCATDCVACTCGGGGEIVSLILFCALNGDERVFQERPRTARMQ
jgi:hypothetical protein